MLLKGYGYVIYLICATVMERWRTGKYESMPGASRASRGQEVRVAGPHSPSPSHSSPQPAFAPPLPPHNVTPASLAEFFLARAQQVGVNSFRAATTVHVCFPVLVT